MGAAHMARSVYELFATTVQNHGDKTGAQYKINGGWRDVTWSEMGVLQKKASAGLVALGVKPKDRVTIWANTRLEWIIADVGILGAGATTVPIYQSSTSEESTFILNDAGSTVVIAEDSVQMEKIRKQAAELPNVKKVICFSPADVAADSELEMSWQDFLALGDDYLKEHADEVEERASGLGPDDILTFIYTSGTTGRPKGTILTHDAMLYESEAMEKIKLVNSDDVQYLFLPMAHVFAKVLEVNWFGQAHVMAMWEGDQAKIIDNLAEVRPTVMCSVPRIFEKVHSKVVSDIKKGTGLTGMLGRWALDKGEEAARLQTQGKKPGGIGWALAQRLVWSKIHDKLEARFGGRLRFFVSGGAPLSKDIAYFFEHAGVKICEGYGLTETSAATCVNLPGNNRIGTVGRPIPGTEVKIADDGEILIRGRGVMKGYWNRPEASKEAIDDKGWFHSGDIGEFDKDGFLRITDRKKDIIVTAGGKNIAPQNLENLIKSKSPLISQVVVHGDQRKFLSAVVTVDEENLKDWAEEKGQGEFDYKAVSQRQDLYQEIENVMTQANGTLARYETLKKFAILDHDFEIGDQLTPTMKVKRKVCNERYKEIFDSFYSA